MLCYVVCCRPVPLSTVQCPLAIRYSTVDRCTIALGCGPAWLVAGRPSAHPSLCYRPALFFLPVSPPPLCYRRGGAHVVKAVRCAIGPHRYPLCLSLSHASSSTPPTLLPSQPAARHFSSAFPQLSAYLLFPSLSLCLVLSPLVSPHLSPLLPPLLPPLLSLPP